MAKSVVQMMVMINVTLFALSLYSPTFAGELRMIGYTLGDVIRGLAQGIGLGPFV